jgi:tetratricopeptide (TPR) repeat protein
MGPELTVRNGDITDEGPLWEGVVPGVLRGVYVGRRTGSLTFLHEDERRGVHFRRGNIVNADTDVREDRLGAVLVRSGRLSEADRRRAEGFAIRDRKRFGTVLLELGLLDRAGLEEALALHVDTVLSKVFAWTDGRYEFRHYDELPLANGEVTLHVSTGDLILQAARSVQDPDVVRYNLGDLKRVLVASSDPLLRFQRIRLTPLDGYVMSRVDGVLSAREVIQLIPLPASDVERSLFALLSTGVVEFRGSKGQLAPDRAPSAMAGAPQPAVGVTAVATKAAALAPPPPPVVPASSPTADQSIVLDDLSRVDGPPPGEPTVVLDGTAGDELPPLDPTVVLDAAAFGERLGAEPTVILDSPRFEERAPLDPTVVVGDVAEPLRPAELRRLEVLEMHQSLGTRDYFDLLGVPRDATEPQVREAYFRLAKRFHPDGQLDADLGGMRDALEAIFRRLGEAYEILRNPRIRVVYENNLARAALIARDESPGPVPTADPAAEDPEGSLARAAESFASERFWEVIQILEKAVPRAHGSLKQRQRVLLARAYARNPDWVKQGEELLVTVVNQDPGDAEAHFHLGVIYRGQGLPSRALRAFRRVLELVPGHPEAQRHVTELQREVRANR